MVKRQQQIRALSLWWFHVTKLGLFVKYKTTTYYDIFANMEESLSHKQALALTKLCAGGTNAEAAKLAGVSTRTIDRWKASPDFQKIMRISVTTVLDSAIAELVLASQVAAKELIGIIQSPDTPSRVKISAITTLFSVVSKAREWEEEKRLQALEDRAYGSLYGKN